jgi:uncharacterized RDD family membrane protein YckC
VARIIDGAILGGVTFVLIVPIYVIMVYAVMTSTTNAYPGQPDPFAVLLPVFGMMAVFFVLTVVLAYLYEVELMFRSGQTFGKRVMKIQVIPVDPTQPLTRVLAAKRFLVQHGSSFVPGLNWVDGLWQLWDKPYRQCLHDKFANTLVIKLKP